MKRIFLPLIILVLLFSTCTHTTNNLTTVHILDNKANFGTIKRGDTVKYNFLIKNTGRNELKIDTMTASCGCIKYIWTKGPILPDCVGFISVSFKPNVEESGKIAKTVMLVTNTKQVYYPLNILYNIDPVNKKNISNEKDLRQ